MPGLDEGFVPQGLTVDGSNIFVAAYKSTSPQFSRGESRVFVVDSRTGTTVDQFNLPDQVGHPGGLACDGKGNLFVADRGGLFQIDLRQAITDGNTNNAVLGRAYVDREIGPSFLAWDNDHIWFGPYERNGEPQIYRFKITNVFPKDRAVYLTPDEASLSFPIDIRTQGATVDGNGYLWLSQSSGNFGVIQRVDSSSGELLDLYEMMPGIEDLSFDSEGRLWSVSEAGSLRWRNWGTFYPLIFSVNISLLK